MFVHCSSSTHSIIYFIFISVFTFEPYGFRLKSGWSVRTASARSPTNIKQAAGGAISDAEQEQIRKVLARAEAGKMNEQQRIGYVIF